MFARSSNVEPPLCVVRAGRERVIDLAAIHGRAFPDGWDVAAMDSLVAHPGARALIAECEGAAVGLILGRIAADEAEILTLAVFPRFRRQGVARALVGVLIDLLRGEGVAGIFLEVGAANEAARALYGGFGFAELGRRRAYYQRAGSAAEDAVVMALGLNTPR